MNQTKLEQMKLKEYYLYVIGFKPRGGIFHIFFGLTTLGIYWVFMMLQRESFIRTYLYIRQYGISSSKTVTSSRVKLFLDFILSFVFFLLNPIWVIVNMGIVDDYSKVSNKLKSTLVIQKIVLFLFFSVLMFILYFNNFYQDSNSIILYGIELLGKIDFIIPSNITSVHVLATFIIFLTSIIISMYILVFYYMLFKIDYIINNYIDENLQLIPQDEKINSMMKKLQHHRRNANRS